VFRKQFGSTPHRYRREVRAARSDVIPI
jgi:hypothetical protein